MTGRLHRIGWIAVVALAAGVICAVAGAIALPRTATTYSTSPVERGSVVTQWEGPLRGHDWLVAGGLVGAICGAVILAALLINHRAAVQRADSAGQEGGSSTVASLLGWLGVATLILALVAVGVGLAALQRHHVLAPNVANPAGSPTIPGHLLLDVATAFLSAGWIAVLVRTGIAMSVGSGRSERAADRPRSVGQDPAFEPTQLT